MEKQILHITASLGGGLQSALVRLHLEIPSQLVVLGKAKYFDKYQIPKSILFVNRFRLISEVIALISNADIIILHSDRASYLRPILKLLTRSKIFYMPHGFYHLNHNLPNSARYLFYLYEKLMSIFTDRYLCLTPHEAAVAKQLSVNRQYYQVKNYPNHNIDCISLSQHRSVVASRLNIISVGRVCHQKGSHLASQLPQRLDHISSSLHFTWIGSGPVSKEFELTNSGWSVSGWLSPDAVRLKLNEASLMLLFSVAEGFPLVINESLAAGCPFLMLEAGYNQHLPNLYKCKDISHLANTINQLKPRDLARLYTHQNEFFKSYYDINEINNLWKLALDPASKPQI